MANLIEELGAIVDPRSRLGRRYSLKSIFALIVAGLMSGHPCLYRISLWGRELTKEQKKRLGFSANTPCAATFSNIVRKIDPDALEAIFSKYCQKNLDADDRHIALDGKSLRNSGDASGKIVHIVSLFLTKTHGILGQKQMRDGENEITAALRLLEETNVEGKIITGDAMFSTKKICAVACKKKCLHIACQK
jgi:hypothetical protein